MFRFVKLLPVSVFVIAVSGCGYERVILLPNADGSDSALILKTETGEHVIDKPYQTVSINSLGMVFFDTENFDFVHKHYKEALEAQPKRPTSYIIYFITGTDEIDPTSLPLIEEVKSDLKSRTVPEIVVIGHTDRVGDEKSNDELSLKRAHVMRNILLSIGITAENIDIAGRGEREPLVPTDDEVEEPKNRRVEISIR